MGSDWILSEDGGPMRTWAPAELVFRESALVELAEVLEELEVAYFVADGTLLGAARDGDFIPWDPDVGIWIKAEIFLLNREKLIELLASKGFVIDKIGGRNPKLNVYKHSEKFELESWRLRGDYRVRGGYKMPAHLLDTPGQIKLRGRHYPCPSPVEEFLSHRFGEDWETPKVLWESHASSKTRWATTKGEVRRRSPKWLIRVLRRR